MTVALDELAALVGGKIDDGSGKIRIGGAQSVADAGAGDITFFGNAKYLPALRECKASAVLVPVDFAETISAATIKVANPSLAFAQVLQKFAPADPEYARGVHPRAVIGENVTLGENSSIQACAVIEPGAKIGAGSFIGANSYVGYDAVIGENCRVYPNVTIRERTVIGSRVIIHSGTVIGSDGFGFELMEGRHVKIPQTGIVQIDDDVEIGANTTIDRARFGRTWIQEGTKVDNLVQIAHNVVIGKHSLIISQTGISGSAQIGNYVTLAGQVGVVGHVKVGDQVIVAAKSGVSKDVAAKQIWFGFVGGPMKEQKEQMVNLRRLPKLFERVKKLEQISGSAAKSLPSED